MISFQDSAKTLKLLRTNVAQTFRVPYKQLPRVFFHGVILSSIISGFWLLDSLKDPVIASTIGIEYQPIAKLISVGTTLVIVCAYDFMTSIVSKPALFHMISNFFGLLTMILSAVLINDTYGMVSGGSTANIRTGGNEKGPHRILGWIAFCTIEAYGSLMVTLFWSFTNSIMDLEQAKGAYGLIIAIAQVGAVIGSTMATNAASIGIAQLFLIGSVMIFSVSLLIKAYHLVFRDEVTEKVKSRVRSISESSATDPLLLAAALSAAARKQNTTSSSSPDVEHIIANRNASHSPLPSPPNSSPMQMIEKSFNFDDIYEGAAGGIGGGGGGSSTTKNDRHHGGNDEDEDLEYDEEDDISDITGFHKPLAGHGIEILNSAHDGGGNTTNTNSAGSSSGGTKRSILNVLWGFSEGLALLFRYPYMVKLLGVSCLYEIIVTVLDYQFKILGSTRTSVQASVHSLTHQDLDIDSMTTAAAAAAAAADTDSNDQFAQLMGHFGQTTNILSFFLSIFGFSYLVHHIGVPNSLLIFPVTLLLAVILTNLVPSLWVLFAMVSIMKAMIFSLHDPVKELLYIPTSEAIKYKTKAWIDVFGSRVAKAIGSTICTIASTGTRGASASAVRRTSEMPSIIIAVCIIFITWWIGQDFQHLTESNTFIGADLADEEEESQYELQQQRSRAASESVSVATAGTAGTDAHSIEMTTTRTISGVSPPPGSLHRKHYLSTLPERGGKKPGEVGYDGYDLQLFEGVFPEDEKI